MPTDVWQGDFFIPGDGVTVTPAAARELLAGRHVAFFGDSLVRRLTATVASHLTTADGGRLANVENEKPLNAGFSARLTATVASHLTTADGGRLEGEENEVGYDWTTFLRKGRGSCGGPWPVAARACDPDSPPSSLLWNWFPLSADMESHFCNNVPTADACSKTHCVKPLAVPPGFYDAPRTVVVVASGTHEIASNVTGIASDADAVSKAVRSVVQALGCICTRLSSTGTLVWRTTPWMTEPPVRVNGVWNKPFQASERVRERNARVLHFNRAVLHGACGAQAEEAADKAAHAATHCLRRRLRLADFAGAMLHHDGGDVQRSFIEPIDRNKVHYINLGRQVAAQLVYRAVRDENGSDTLACARGADGRLAAFEAPGWQFTKSWPVV